ncbi:glycosyltransferase [Actinomycetospora sp. Odt1-22]|uniref:Glycosyltransferase n=1 Tax=Actinomycetospora termitidis TaxID=3053470 RepID=A0ABT7M7F2_9PSEU|nr:macrolide family glycosyltransferase [Actinomycetospora sp. Odt1-22]MDL5155967.1 glycosyltransferase [Actinomycetospora sp. Odt1-22]
MHIVMVGAGAHGHINPNLPVIAELVARGHRVRYAVSGPFAELVASSGATPLLHTSVLPDETRDEAWPEDPVVGMQLFLDEGRHVTPQLEAALENDRPDVFLADIGGYAARVLGRRWGVPCVQLSPAMVAWEGFEHATGMAGLLETPEGAAFRADFADWLAAEGVDLAPETFMGIPDSSIVLIPRQLQPHADKVDPDRYTFVGPCLDAREHQGDWDDDVDVLVSLGSAYTADPAFWRTVAEAFAGRRTVLAIGRRIDPADLGELPDGVTAHAWIPQLAVLRRTSLFVTHAGMGGCSEGLATATPMIAIPQAVDQFGNAEMLEAAGIGVTVDRAAVTVEALRGAAATLDTDAVRTRSRAAADELAAAGGARRAADLVEQVRS